MLKFSSTHVYFAAEKVSEVNVKANRGINNLPLILDCHLGRLASSLASSSHQLQSNGRYLLENRIVAINHVLASHSVNSDQLHGAALRQFKNSVKVADVCFVLHIPMSNK